MLMVSHRHTRVTSSMLWQEFALIGTCRPGRVHGISCIIIHTCTRRLQVAVLYKRTKIVALMEKNGGELLRSAGLAVVSVRLQ